MELSGALTDRLSRVTLLILDCDGVLTDGRLYFTERGEEMKVFDVRDGYGLVLWHRAGFRSGIISGRKSPILNSRADDLGIEFVWQSREDKETAFREVLAAAGCEPVETAYVGDDLIDVPVLEMAGFSVAPADAH